MIWENATYEFANQCVEKSWAQWERNDLVESWGYTIPARLAYVTDLVINVAVFPLAIIRVTFGSLYAIARWDSSTHEYQSGKHYIIERTNHVLLSLVGSILPSVAHRYRDVDLAPYVIAARIAVITWGILYYGYSKFR